MPKIPKIKLAAEYLLKLADAHAEAKAEEAEQAHEQSETPEQEALEHMPGEYEEHGEVLPEESPEPELSEHPEVEGLPEGLEDTDLPSEEAHEDAAVEQMLSQLSPEQIDQLASQLSEDIQHPEQREDDDTAELAQAIQEHLADNPEAAVPEASSEKMAALNLMKSAEYIEGFLNQATSSGVSIKEAVDTYDYTLVNFLNEIKTAATKEKHELEESSEEEKSEHEDKEEELDELKKAAYFQGIVERAREYGFTDFETLGFVKQAGLADLLRATKAGIKSTATKARDAVKDVAENPRVRGAAKNLGRFLKDTKPVKAVRDTIDETKNAVGVAARKAKSLFKDLTTSKNKPKRSPFAARIRGEGADFGYVDRSGGGGAPFFKKKAELDDKVAAYHEGFFLQGETYGFTPIEINELLKQSGVTARVARKGVEGIRRARKAVRPTKIPSAYEAASARYPAGATFPDIPGTPSAAAAASSKPGASAAHAAESAEKGRFKGDPFTLDEREMYRQAQRKPANHRTPEEQELIHRMDHESAARVHSGEKSRATPLPDKETAAQKKLRNKARAQADPSSEASFANTFDHAMSGVEGPLPPGMEHAIAARLGRAGKFVVDNPLTSGVAGGVGAFGLAHGLAGSPHEIPEQYYPYQR
jgi:hypothetical protein